MFICLCPVSELIAFLVADQDVIYTKELESLPQGTFGSRES
jgi:hypothetical protein